MKWSENKADPEAGESRVSGVRPDLSKSLLTGLQEWMRSRRAKELSVDLLYSMPQFIIYFGVLLLPFIIALPMIFTDRVDFLDTEVDFVGLTNFISVLQGNLQNQFFNALRSKSRIV